MKLLGEWRKKEKDYEGLSLEDPRAEEDSERLLEDFRKTSEKNLVEASEFFFHRLKLAEQSLGTENLHHGSPLMETILNPGAPVEAGTEEMASRGEMAGAIAAVDEAHGPFDPRKNMTEYVEKLEHRKMEGLKRSDWMRKRREMALRGRFQNYHFLGEVGEGLSLEFNLLKAGIKCAMVMSDTFHTRSSNFYRKIMATLEGNRIPYVEFTNIQPNLDRKLVFRMYEFARNHGVNSLVVVGSVSTIEVAKLLLPKLMQPNIISLHRDREFEKSLAEKFSVFSIPTLVVPDPAVNSRSVVRNNLFALGHRLWESVLYLKGEMDDSNGVFYFSEALDLLSREKLMEALHETYFRLIFSYFDLSARDSVLESLTEHIKRVERMLETYSFTGEFEAYERRELMKIVSFTMDGRIMVDVLDFWILHRLEGALSLMVNSKKSEGLALFMPVFMEIMAKKSLEFKTRLIQLGTKIYGTYSVEGFIYRLLMHIRKYGLPISLAEIKGVTKVDYRFLSDLLKQARIGNRYSPVVKAMMQQLNIG